MYAGLQDELLDYLNGGNEMDPEKVALLTSGAKWDREAWEAAPDAGLMLFGVADLVSMAGASGHADLMNDMVRWGSYRDPSWNVETPRRTSTLKEDVMMLGQFATMAVPVTAAVYGTGALVTMAAARAWAASPRAMGAATAVAPAVSQFANASSQWVKQNTQWLLPSMRGMTQGQHVLNKQGLLVDTLGQASRTGMQLNPVWRRAMLVSFGTSLGLTGLSTADQIMNPGATVEGDARAIAGRDAMLDADLAALADMSADPAQITAALSGHMTDAGNPLITDPATVEWALSQSAELPPGVTVDVRYPSIMYANEQGGRSLDLMPRDQTVQEILNQHTSNRLRSGETVAGMSRAFVDLGAVAADLEATGVPREALNLGGGPGNVQAWTDFASSQPRDGTGPYTINAETGSTTRIVDLTYADDFGALDRLLQEVRATTGAQGNYEDDPLIGVPQGYIGQAGSNLVQFDQNRKTGPGTMDAGAMHSATGSVGMLYNQDPNALGYNPGSPTAVPATYHMSDAAAVLFNMTPHQIERTQAAMAKAGLIDLEAVGFLPGNPDLNTLAALQTTMGNANGIGRSWTSTLELMGSYWQDVTRDRTNDGRRGSGASSRMAFTPSTPYFSLDPDEVAQTVKQTVEQRLRREANDWEIRDIGATMEDTHREAYDTRIAAERAVYDARGRAAEKIVEEFEAVDEGASFTEDFEGRYDTELDEVKRWDSMKRDTQSLFAGLGNMSSQMGGV